MKNRENTYLYQDLDLSGVEISGGKAQKLFVSNNS